MSFGNLSVNGCFGDRMSLIQELSLVLSIELMKNGGINQHRLDFAKVEQRLIEISEILIGISLVNYTVWFYYF